MPRYNYKYFAGYEKTCTERRDTPAITEELGRVAPLLHQSWLCLTGSILEGQILSRCYANWMPAGLGGAVHRDSPISKHLTAIYYPQPTWSPHEGGETVFFDHTMNEIINRISKTKPACRLFGLDPPRCPSDLRQRQSSADHADIQDFRVRRDEPWPRGRQLAQLVGYPEKR